MKQTQGMWIVGVYDATANFLSIKEHTCVCVAENRMLVATCGPANDDQSQADAHLIAAAPALLDALTELLAFEDESIPESMWGSGYQATIYKALAAIAKAKGQS